MPPCSRMNAPAAASSSSVVTPGASSPPTCAIVSATSAPAAAIFSISRELLRMITWPSLPRARPGSPRRPSSIVCSPSTMTSIPASLIAVDDELGELVIEAEAVARWPRASRLRDPSWAARSRSRSVATSSETWSRITASSGLPMSSSIESSASACAIVRGKPSRTKPVLVREALADEADHEVVRHQVAALEDRARPARRARSRSATAARAGCRPSRRAGRRSQRRSALPGSLFRTPVGRG